MKGRNCQLVPCMTPRARSWMIVQACCWLCDHLSQLPSALREAAHTWLSWHCDFFIYFLSESRSLRQVSVRLFCGASPTSHIRIGHSNVEFHRPTARPLCHSYHYGRNYAFFFNQASRRLTLATVVMPVVRQPTENANAKPLHLPANVTKL